MASLLVEREAALRGSAQYVCPLCRNAVSELAFKVAPLSSPSKPEALTARILR
jgi:hypothetical protein